jgi:nitrogen fixation protein NifQ
MRAAEVQAWLQGGAEPSACEAFDAHALSAILALAVAEAQSARTPVPEGVGLDGAALHALVRAHFPNAAAVFARIADEALAPPSDEEEALRELLRGAGSSVLAPVFAPLVARRCLRPNHLWQDLGLRHRRELSWLMERHFEPLARRNRSDMKWKKFLYRQICAGDGFRICTAPVCAECDDFAACFGAEDGESLLARMRNAA